MFTITNQFQTTLAQGGGAGGGVESVIRGDCEWKEGKLLRLGFCPNYVQEFSLCTITS
jgi:hypothetical protein